MDKPVSMSVKDYIIRKMSVSIMMPENVIKDVVEFQYKHLIEAMESGKVDSIDICGLGRLFKNRGRLVKMVASHQERCNRLVEQYDVLKAHVGSYRDGEMPELQGQTKRELKSLERKIGNAKAKIEQLKKYL